MDARNTDGNRQLPHADEEAGEILKEHCFCTPQREYCCSFKAQSYNGTDLEDTPWSYTSKL